MKNFLKIFLIFLYFSLCFLYKDDFEAHIKTNEISYSNIGISIQHINFQDNSTLTQNNNQEIINIQNSKGHNSTDFYKNNRFVFKNINYKLHIKYCLRQNILAFNQENKINARAP
jgi:hypothetical protein